MNFLKNIEVNFISLVRKGANRKTIIYKSDGEQTMTFEVKFAKTNEEKQMVYGIVYAPDEKDTQGDYTNAAEIEKAAYGFMKNLNLQNIDKQHTFKPEEAYIAESWLIRKGDELFPKEKPGAWAVGVKVEDAELWKEVKEKKITGLSMAGTGDRVVKKEKEDEKESVLDILKSFLKKEKEVPTKTDKTEMTEEGVTKIVMKCLEGLINKVDQQKNSDSGQSKMMKLIKEQKKEIEELKKFSKGMQQPSESELLKQEKTEADVGLDIAKMMNA